MEIIDIWLVAIACSATIIFAFVLFIWIGYFFEGKKIPKNKVSAIQKEDLISKEALESMKYLAEYTERVAKVVDGLKSGNQSRWRPASEKPKNDPSFYKMSVPVLATDGKKVGMAVYLFDVNEWDFKPFSKSNDIDLNVTHWQYIDEIPK